MWRSFDDFVADADPDDTLVTDNGGEHTDVRRWRRPPTPNDGAPLRHAELERLGRTSR